MTDHTELRDRIRRAVYERLAHGPSAPDVLDPIADAAMSVIAPERDEARAQIERLTNALTNARAVSDDRIADREAALRDIMRERDEARAERAALWDLLKRKTRESRTWRRRASTAIADAVEQTARDMQRCGQLRHDLAEARAELDRLRAAAAQVRRHWLSQWPSSRHAVRDVSPPLHDAIDTLAARSQAAADNTCTRPLVDRVQVFYGDDEVSEVIEAPRAQRPTEETR